LLPRVFYPTYKLNYVTIYGEEDAVIVEYETVEKQDPSELTFLERTLTRSPKPAPEIPSRTVVDGGQESRTVHTDERPDAPPTVGDRVE
jgi:hypothetical protein